MGYQTYDNVNQLNAMMDAMGFFLVILICIGFAVALSFYIINSLAYWKIGKRSDIGWSWMAWFPLGFLFIQAKASKWDHWWLIPVLYLCSGFLAMKVPIVGFLIPPVTLVLLIIQMVHVMKGLGKDPLLLLLTLIPLIGSIIFMIILYNAAFSSNKPLQVEPRTWYGKLKNTDDPLFS